MKSWSEARRELPSASQERMDEKLAVMSLVKLEWRRRIERTLAIGSILLAHYLRVFIFLKISPGALLVYLCFGCGVLLARRVAIESRRGRFQSRFDLSSELWAKWEMLLGVFQGGSIAVVSIAQSSESGA